MSYARTSEQTVVMNRIKAESLLQKRELQAYSLFFLQGPMTRNELNKAGGGVVQLDKRIAKLQERKAVKVVGERVCSVTGAKCACYDITGELPGGAAKSEGTPKPTREQFRAALDELKPLIEGKAHTVPSLMVVARWMSKQAPPGYRAEVLASGEPEAEPASES